MTNHRVCLRRHPHAPVQRFVHLSAVARATSSLPRCPSWLRARLRVDRLLRETLHLCLQVVPSTPCALRWLAQVYELNREFDVAYSRCRRIWLDSRMPRWMPRRARRQTLNSPPRLGTMRPSPSHPWLALRHYGRLIFSSSRH